MSLRVIVFASSVAALVLYILAVTIGAWPCGGLFRGCEWGRNETASEIRDYRVIGGLLVSSALFTGLSLALTAASVHFEQNSIRYVSYSGSLVAFVLGLTAELIFYTRIRYDWPALLSTVGMTLCLTVACIQLSHLIMVKCFYIEHYTPEFL